MISEQTLLKELKERKMACYKVAQIKDTDKRIEFTTLADFFCFIDTEKISSVFYSYVTLNEEMLVINKESVPNAMYQSEIVAVLQDDIDEYNEYIKIMNFESPIACEVYCIYQNIIIGYFEESTWYYEFGILFPPQKFQEMVEEHREIVKNANKVKLRKNNEKLKVYREMIGYDPVFYNATSPKLRDAYHKKLIKNDVNYGMLIKQNAILSSEDFIESVWKEYHTDHH